MLGNSSIDFFAEDFETGTVLFEEGDAGDKMYVVQSGRVSISRMIAGGNQILARLPAGEFFGEMSLLSGRPRSATAIILEPSRLLIIDGGTFESMVRSRSEIAVRLIKTMADRLEKSNRRVELLLLTDNTHRVVTALRHLADSAQEPNEGPVFLNISLDGLAEYTALPVAELSEIVERLALARLVVYAKEAGIDETGFVVPEVDRLLEFLDFLDLKDRFGPLDGV
ncbi:MAG: Crp/Fnr family transcriptional regulator [Kofleriaceae bacterium]|nr:Crp/Fnr family transcriptional regulator [Kofleriaceae bacterium]